MKCKKYVSTRKAAELIGVHHLTLHRWLQQGKVKCNFTLAWDSRKLYRWSEDDIEKLKQFKQANGGRWPKKQT